MTAVGTVRERGRWRWWTALVALVCVFGVYSVSVGQFLVGMREPDHLGHGTVGEWADLSDYGFRLRLDGIELHESMPSRWDETRFEYPPQGMHYVEARFTVEVLVPQDVDIGCDFRLLNADGEEFGLVGIGMAGAEASECHHQDERAGIGVGDEFTSHEVYVVPRNYTDGFTLRVTPYFTDDDVYWTFSE